MLVRKDVQQSFRPTGSKASQIISDKQSIQLVLIKKNINTYNIDGRIFARSFLINTKSRRAEACLLVICKSLPFPLKNKIENRD